VTVESKDNTLLIPSQAIKTQGSRSYVQVLKNYTRANGSKFGPVTATTAPQNVVVTVGDSNDTMTEITSGLNAGDMVVTQTITGTVAVSATSATSALRLGGGSGFGGGGFTGGGVGGGTRTGATGGSAATSAGR